MFLCAYKSNPKCWFKLEGFPEFNKHLWWCVYDLGFQTVSDAMLAELKQCFMEAYDDNRDGKIDIREVSVAFQNMFFIPLNLEIQVLSPSSFYLPAQNRDN